MSATALCYPTLIYFNLMLVVSSSVVVLVVCRRLQHPCTKRSERHALAADQSPSSGCHSDVHVQPRLRLRQQNVEDNVTEHVH